MIDGMRFRWIWSPLVFGVAALSALLAGCGSSGSSSGTAALPGPTSLTAMAVSPTEVDLQWADNSQSETSFVIERSITSGIFSQINQVPANQTTYQDRGALPNTAYSYRVRAVSSAGTSAPSNVVTLTTPQGQSPTRSFITSSLVTDSAGQAPSVDNDLLDPWGIAQDGSGQFWVANEGTGTLTSYDRNGVRGAYRVTVDLPAGSTAVHSSPTGLVLNPTSDFTVTSGGSSAPSTIITATQDGTICAWNESVNPQHALVVADRSSSGAIYKGLAFGSTAQGNTLYAANFNSGSVDVFDKGFAYVSSFTDATMPAGFAPFGIQNIAGQLYVTFALQDATKLNNVPGAGNGFVDQFDLSGNLVRRFASGGPLNSPWGVATAPASFGLFAGDIVVANAGDGHMNAFDPSTGAFLGQLLDTASNTILITGLKGLAIDSATGGTDALFYTASQGSALHGALGDITPVVLSTPATRAR